MNSTVSSHQHHPYGNYRSSDLSYFRSQLDPLGEFFVNDNDQITTLEKFNSIIDCYLNNLSPKKRDKALVDQCRYLQILKVLNDPRNTANSTAQFRFWVKKMFQLQIGSIDMVYHDNKPVATKEKIYDILVKAHREVHHGGRDKTSALVRAKYSWIPKELVAQFVRNCSFCIVRRNSGSNLVTSKTMRTQIVKNTYSFDFGIYTEIPLNEDSDLSSGQSYSVNSYKPINYSCVSSPPSPETIDRPIYSQEGHGFSNCDYQTPLQSFSNIPDKPKYYPYSSYPLIQDDLDNVLFYAQSQDNQSSHLSSSLYNHYSTSTADSQRHIPNGVFMYPHTNQNSFSSGPVLSFM